MDLYKERLKNDFAFYVKEKLNVPSETDTDGNPVPMIITGIHENAIYEIIDNKFVEIIAYRWWGKSILISFAYTVWRADMHNESSAILSSNETLAMQKLDWIRTEVEFGNPNLINMSAAGIVGMTWNRWEIWLLDRNHPIQRPGKNGQMDTTYRIKAKIYALGIGGSFRWIHVHNVIADDIVVEENSATYELREWIKRKFLGAAWGLRLRWDKTRVILVGTPQHPEDILQTIRRQDNGYGKFILPALNEFGMPSCPEMHDIVWINETRKFQWEEIFRQEYMLEAPDMSNVDLFGELLLDDSKDKASIMLFQYDKKEDEILILGTDFSIIEDKERAEKNDNDYFALILIAFNTITSERRIINMYRERWLSKTAQLNLVLLWERNYNIDAIAVEMHAFLSWAAQDIKNNTKAKLFDTGDKKGKYNMITGIPALQYTFEKKLFKFPYYDDYSKEFVNALFWELKMLNKSLHDDFSDALLRAELVIRANETGTIEYDATYNMYKIMSRKKKEQTRSQKAINERLGGLLRW